MLNLAVVQAEFQWTRTCAVYMTQKANSYAVARFENGANHGHHIFRHQHLCLKHHGIHTAPRDASESQASAIASTLPCAFPIKAQTWSSSSCIRWRGSFGGSMATGLFWSAFPRRNAVLMSREVRTQCLEEIGWKTVCRPSRVSVGASLLTSVRRGPWYPSITSLALDLCPDPEADSLSDIAFPVRTHLDFRICSGFKGFLRTGLRALVWSQQESSASLAASNNSRSAWLRSFDLNLCTGSLTGWGHLSKLLRMFSSWPFQDILSWHGNLKHEHTDGPVVGVDSLCRACHLLQDTSGYGLSPHGKHFVHEWFHPFQGCKHHDMWVRHLRHLDLWHGLRVHQGQWHYHWSFHWIHVVVDYFHWDYFEDRLQGYLQG